ncbi:hypothetical protein M9Y10_029360 [Tritrichomonas musculus]|uniref:Uncharacterized protein n=1 Tax=Tritrichomonas musculus TaxID=1915356 RepID=A0ABR2KMI5_9EUKA
MRKTSRLSSQKREKSTPAKAVTRDKNDDPPDLTAIIQKLEADNRKVANKYQDLEFQLEEVQVKNELLNKLNSNDVSNDDEFNDQIDLDELKQSVISLRREKRDEEERFKYSQYVLQEKSADIEFLQFEMNELNLIAPRIDSSSPEVQKALEKQLKEMNEELKTNEDRLTILRKEESDAKENMKKREIVMKGHNSAKPLPANWTEERNEILKKQQKMNNKLNHLNEKQRELLDQLTNLKTQFYTDLEIDDKELKKTLVAELECNSNPAAANLQNAIAAEIEYNNILESELNEVRATTEYIKKYRETCFNRGKNQFELESSRKRIELLQEQLNKISQHFST